MHPKSLTFDTCCECQRRVFPKQKSSFDLVEAVASNRGLSNKKSCLSKLADNLAWYVLPIDSVQVQIYESFLFEKYFLGE